MHDERTQKGNKQKIGLVLASPWWSLKVTAVNWSLTAYCNMVYSATQLLPSILQTKPKCTPYSNEHHQHRHNHVHVHIICSGPEGSYLFVTVYELTSFWLQEDNIHVQLPIHHTVLWRWHWNVVYTQRFERELFTYPHICLRIWILGWIYSPI